MSTTPHGPGGPEYIESGGGTRVAREPGSGRKSALIGAGVFGGLLLAGGAAWAAASFLATGDQPAQALPASTIAYASVDLDPSGGQKVEAISTLRKFPAFREHIGLETDDDVRRKIFDEITQSGECEGLDYAEDIEPWLGDRAAVAAVDTGGEQPSPVVVVQVTDSDAAEKGLATLRDTCGGEAEASGWTVDGDWALIAEDEKTATTITEATADGTLADDETYQRWVDETGTAGIASVYAAPAAAELLLQELGGMPLGIPGETVGGTDQEQAMPPEMASALEDFEGMAATLRFADGGLELELAGDAGKQADSLSTEGGVDALSTLPGDTVAALGMNLADGWFDTFAEQVAASAGGSMTKEDLYTELENQTGLQLPEDLETLTGESVAVALGGGFDPEAAFNSADPSGVPVGVKVEGDTDRIESVLEKLRSAAPELAELIPSQADGDFVAVSPNDDYRSELVDSGTLGDSAAFRSVVGDADRAGAVLFVDFDAGNEWLAGLAAGDPTSKENLEPLSAFGISAWRDGDVSHGVVRLTTD